MPVFSQNTQPVYMVVGPMSLMLQRNAYFIVLIFLNRPLLPFGVEGFN
jgi:hypothetical protein